MNESTSNLSKLVEPSIPGFPSVVAAILCKSTDLNSSKINDVADIFSSTFVGVDNVIRNISTRTNTDLQGITQYFDNKDGIHICEVIQNDNKIRIISKANCKKEDVPDEYFNFILYCVIDSFDIVYPVTLVHMLYSEKLDNGKSIEIKYDIEL